MTNEGLKKKIVEILDNNIRWHPYYYISRGIVYEDDLKNIADALIAAGIGDIQDIREKANLDISGTTSNPTQYTGAPADPQEPKIKKWYRNTVGHEPANYDAAALKAYIAHLEAENAELQEKDINCVNSVDEMIAMCDGCGLFDCCGCEHSYVAVQGVKELKYRAERAERAVENLAYKRAKTLLDDDSKEAMEKIKQAELQQTEKELKEGGERMKIINRAQLRGKPLDKMCRRAHTAPNQYANDNRIFCYGMIDLMYDEPCEECQQCKAFVRNAEPLQRRGNDD